MVRPTIRKETWRIRARNGKAFGTDVVRRIVAGCIGLLESPANRNLVKDAEQFQMSIRFLSECPMLSTSGNANDDILFNQAFEESWVVYFFVPTITGSVTARMVASLGLYTAIHAAIRRKKLGKPKRFARIFVDEFQSICGGPNTGDLLAQAAKFHCSLILFHQSTSQLQTKDTDLSNIVFEGCSTKVYFTCVGGARYRRLAEFEWRQDNDSWRNLNAEILAIHKYARDDRPEIGKGHDSQGILDLRSGLCRS